MATTFDVCIRGGGITGRTLALLLAKERLKVNLVVAPTASNATAVPDVRAYALNQRSKTLLESVRCWPAPAHATPVLKMRVQGDDGGQVDFDAAHSQADALAWIVDVGVLDAQLAQACQFQAQIEQSTEAHNATLTVICEGKASRSRDELGVEFDVAAYSQHAIAARMDCEYSHLQTARQWFAKDAILGILPMGLAPAFDTARGSGDSSDPLAEADEFDSAYSPDLINPTNSSDSTGSPDLIRQGGNSIAIVWSIEQARAQELMALSPEDFAKAVQVATHGEFGHMVLTSERAMWPLQLAQTQRWVGQKRDEKGVQAWALAGDAAHTVHPLSGQGLNLGLADVAELAQLLAKRDYWRSVGDERLLRRYERSRKLEASKLGATTDGLQRLFAQNGNLWQTLRNVGMNGFERSGPLKSWVARQAMGL